MPESIHSVELTERAAQTYLDADRCPWDGKALVERHGLTPETGGRLRWEHWFECRGGTTHVFAGRYNGLGEYIPVWNNR